MLTILRFIFGITYGKCDQINTNMSSIGLVIHEIPFQILRFRENSLKILLKKLSNDKIILFINLEFNLKKKSIWFSSIIAHNDKKFKNIQNYFFILNLTFHYIEVSSS